MDNISIFSIAVSQVSQIGLSACGATAVINALLALDSSHTTATVAEQGRISDNIHVEIEKETYSWTYRVIHTVRHMTLIDFDLGIPQFCMTDLPILPLFHLPKQNWADTEMIKSKSTRPTTRPYE